MSRDVTVCNVSCNLLAESRPASYAWMGRDWEVFSNSEFLLAAQQKYCETSCKSDVTLQCLKNALQRCGNYCEK